MISSSLPQLQQTETDGVNYGVPYQFPISYTQLFRTNRGKCGCDNYRDVTSSGMIILVVGSRYNCKPFLKYELREFTTVVTVMTGKLKDFFLRLVAEIMLDLVNNY